MSGNRPDLVQRLREQYNEHEGVFDDDGNMCGMKRTLEHEAADEIESLRQQLAECERERDRWRDNYLRNDASEFAAVTKERDELVEALAIMHTTHPLLDSDDEDVVACFRASAAALAKVGAGGTGEK